MYALGQKQAYAPQQSCQRGTDCFESLTFFSRLWNLTVLPALWWRPQRRWRATMSVGTIVLIILVIILLGGFSGFGGGPFYGTGYYGGGGLGLVIIILLILILLGRI